MYICHPTSAANTGKRYESGSFDAVVDKGTLDALMSEDTAKVRESGGAMLGEVKRILKPASGR